MKRQRVRRAVLFVAFLSFPITMNYFSPYLMVAGTAQGVAVFSLFLWGAWFLSSLAIGRAACGYVCPLGGLGMIADTLLRLVHRSVRHLRLVKYGLWAAWMACTAVLAVSHGGYRSVDLLFMTPTGVSVDSAASLITYYTLILIVLIPSFFLGKAGFCHYLCPFSVFNIAGSRLKTILVPRLRLTLTGKPCTGCQRCDEVCPMSLPVSVMVESGNMDNTECVLCGICVDHCPNGAVTYSFTRV